jgi:hypothetical protein
MLVVLASSSASAEDDSSSCSKEQDTFDNAVAAITAQKENELSMVAKKTNSEIEKLERQFETSQNMSEGVGAAVGTAVGAGLGAQGAITGAIVGQHIGKLLTVEVRAKTVQFSAKVPTFSTQKREFAISIPQVTSYRKDIVFKKPQVVMVRRRGPNIPNGFKCRRFKCTPTYKESWIEVPEFKMVEHRISFDVPRVSMRALNGNFASPQISFKQRSFSFSVPVIAVRFNGDAGKELASAAEKIAREANQASSDIESSYRLILKEGGLPPLIAYFDCERVGIRKSMLESTASIDREISTLNESLLALSAQGVPEGNVEYQELKAVIAVQIENRTAALTPWAEASAQLDKAATEAIEKFAN